MGRLYDAYVEVGPRFTGFGEIKKQGQQAGTDFGKAMTEAAEKAAKANVRRLGEALAKARSAEADAAGKVRVAEARLAEIRANSKSKTSQIAAAEEALASALRKSSAASDSAKDAAEALDRARDRVSSGADAAGKTTGGRFSRAFRGAMSKMGGEKEGKQFASRFGVGLNGAVGSIVSKSAGVFAAGFAGLQVGGFLKDAISQASDLGETMSKSATVFGGANKQILAFAKNAPTALGQTKQEAIGAASSFGNLFTQLGISQTAAAGMSTQMVTLASDFASFHNADITEVLEAQQAAFRGEFDSIQKFVPTINAAAVEQEALRLKLAGSTKEIDDQDKAIATQSLLMKGAGKAAGDFARTSGGLANQQRILKAQFADATAELGTKLLPVATQFFTWLNQSAFPWIKGFVQSEGFTGFLAKVRSGAGSAFGFFKTEVLPRLQEFAGYVRETVIPIIVNLVQDRLAKLREMFGFVREAIQENRPQLEQLGSAIQSVAKWIIEKLVPFLAKLSNETLPIVGRVIGATIDLISDWVDIFNSLKSTATSVVRTVWEKVSGFFGNLVEGAAKAFGWVPGLGPKLKTAATEFGKFRDSVNEKLDGINDEPVDIKVGLAYTQALGQRTKQMKFASGGAVFGAGTATSDSVPAMLSNGEHVWTAKEVQNAGGHKAVEAMRQQFRGYATGGGVDVRGYFPSGKRLAKLMGRASLDVDHIGTAVAKSIANELASQAIPAGAPGARKSFRGVTLNTRTIGMLLQAERSLGRMFRIFQGSYSTRVAASGSTHAGGGAMDTDGPGGWAAAVRALRGSGFAAWHRTPAQGPWGHHIHAIAIGDPSASPAAQAQVRSFLRGGNGLGGMALGGRVGVYDRGGRWPSGTLGVNLSGKTETVIPADGTVRLDRATIRDLARAMVEAARESPILLDGKRIDEAMTRRAVGAGGSIR